MNYFSHKKKSHCCYATLFRKPPRSITGSTMKHYEINLYACKFKLKTQTNERTSDPAVSAKL